MLDTNELTVTHNTVDAEPTVTELNSDHIKYHLHYLAEYHLGKLRKLINNGEILTHLTEFDSSVAETVERQVEKWKVNDRGYYESLDVGDFCKAKGLDNMLRLCAREAIYKDMVYV